MVHTAGDALICVFEPGIDEEGNDAKDDAREKGEGNQTYHPRQGGETRYFEGAAARAEECARRVLLKFSDEYLTRYPALNVNGAVGRGELTVVHLAGGGGGRFGSQGGGILTPATETMGAETGAAAMTFGDRRHLTVCGEALDRAIELQSTSQRKGEFLFDRGTQSGQAPDRVTIAEVRRDSVAELQSLTLLSRTASENKDRDSDAGNELCARYAPDFFCRKRTGDGFTGDLMYQTGRRLHVCTLFVQLINMHRDENVSKGSSGGGGDPSSPSSSSVDVDRLNLAFGVLRESVATLDGLVDTLLCDDKGFVFKAVFGLTGEAEDVEIRGTLCALRALDALSSRGVVARAGVASGPAFCGPVYGGSGHYVAFTMLGREGVTLGARLMCSASEGRILCSPSVRSKVRRDVLFMDAEDMAEQDNACGGVGGGEDISHKGAGEATVTRTLHLKGVAHPIPCNVPIA